MFFVCLSAWLPVWLFLSVYLLCLCLSVLSLCEGTPFLPYDGGGRCRILKFMFFCLSVSFCLSAVSVCLSVLSLCEGTLFSPYDGGDASNFKIHLFFFTEID